MKTETYEGITRSPAIQVDYEDEEVQIWGAHVGQRFTTAQWKYFILSEYRRLGLGQR